MPPTTETMAALATGNTLTTAVVIDFLARQGVIRLEDVIAHLDATTANVQNDFGDQNLATMPVRHLADMLRRLAAGQSPMLQ